MDSRNLGKELMMNLMKFRRLPHKQHEHSGIHPGERHALFMILRLTRNHPEGIRISDISKALNVAPPTVTQKIRSLEKKGMVRRVHSEKDRRTVLITLSNKAKEHLDHVHDEWLDRCIELVEYLGEKESRQFLSTLSRSFEYFQNRKDNRENEDD